MGTTTTDRIWRVNRHLSALLRLAARLKAEGIDGRR
jgi:hypothetical protein